MHDTSKHDRARPDTRRRTTLAAIVAAVAVVATLAACSDDGGNGGGGGEKADSGHSADSATTSPERRTTTTAPPATTPPTTAAPAPAPATPVAATTPAGPAAAPRPEPILRDGRHPVYLTDVDVAGATVQFDLLQYLVGDAAEAYEEAHPDEYPEGEEYEDYDHSPFHNDNPRLRRLAVVADVPVFVQGRISGCDGPHTTTFAALAAYVGRNVIPGSGHLGHQPFWLTVEDGIVVDIAEIGCAG